MAGPHPANSELSSDPDPQLTRSGDLTKRVGQVEAGSTQLCSNTSKGSVSDAALSNSLPHTNYDLGTIRLLAIRRLVMVSDDDYRQDTFPPLSLWQVLRIAPHFLVLRTHQTPNTPAPHNLS
jgi:hypothetical protein